MTWDDLYSAARFRPDTAEYQAWLRDGKLAPDTQMCSVTRWFYLIHRMASGCRLLVGWSGIMSSSSHAIHDFRHYRNARFKHNTTLPNRTEPEVFLRTWPCKASWLQRKDHKIHQDSKHRKKFAQETGALRAPAARVVEPWVSFLNVLRGTAIVSRPPVGLLLGEPWLLQWLLWNELEQVPGCFERLISCTITDFSQFRALLYTLCQLIRLFFLHLS